MDLIPGLPNDLATQCLLRVHCTQLAALSSLSKAWKSLLRSKEFWRRRKLLRNNKQVILLKCQSGNIRKLILLEPETNIWSELPPIPEFPNGVPENFRFEIVSFKLGFVVAGRFFEDYTGNTPSCNKIFVFDYISGTWQRGADLQERRLSFNRCTSDGDRMVYVLLALRKSELSLNTECIMVYDVMKDEWSSRIDLGKYRGYISTGSTRRMIYQSGKIHLLYEGIRLSDGYMSFDDKTVFNVSTWKWDPPQLHFHDQRASAVFLSDEGEWYSHRREYGTLAIYEHSTWKDAVHAPNELKQFNYITTWKSKVLFMPRKPNYLSWDPIEEDLEARILDLKTHEWNTLDFPKEIRVEVEAGCYLEI